MKKIFLAVVALAAMTACSNDEFVSVDRAPINFGEAFVDNATRADYSSTQIKHFKVYGTVTGNGKTVNLYDGADVTGNTYGTVWSCTQSEYWLPNCSYVFEAVVDGEISGGKIVYNIGDDTGNDNVSDLLYATASVATDETATPETGDFVTIDSKPVVAFTFAHLLSKIGFTFQAGVNDAKYAYKVNAISFTGHDSTGTYTINGGSWDNAYTASTEALTFDAPTGNIATTAVVAAGTTHQIIPGQQTLSVSITYDIIYKGETVSPGITVTKELSHNFAKNSVYNIAVTLPAPGQPIKFTVKAENGVNGWANGGELNVQ